MLLACEGNPFDETVEAGPGVSGFNVTAASKQVLHDWLGEGGKVFATHFHYTWFMNGPPDFQGLATWKGYSIGTATGNEAIVTTFPKGQDFSTELADAGLLTNGEIALNKVADSVSSVNAPALAWLRDPSSGDTKYMTFTTPVGSACGKVGFSDLHVGGAPSGNIPAACAAQDLSAQEKAIELLFFNLSACVSDDTKAAPAAGLAVRPGRGNRPLKGRPTERRHIPSPGTLGQRWQDARAGHRESRGQRRRFVRPTTLD